MPKKENLKAQGHFYRFTAEAADRAKVPADLQKRMLFEIFLIREFESRLLELKDLGLAHGPVHSSIGQEGAAVGAIRALVKDDLVASTHRGHHHFLAKAFEAYLGNYNPEAGIPSELPSLVKKTMAEILGLAQGFCRGRGGSMHLADKACGCLGTNAIVAGGVPLATGAAWARRIDGKPNVAVSFLGDGAVHQGAVHEVMNMADLWHIPVIYFIENNLYAVATHVKESCSLDHLAQRGLGYGMESMVVDGMDPNAVYLAMTEAKKYAVSKKGGPVVIEAKTYRYKHQAQSLPGSAFGYRTKAEEEEWLKFDPVVTYPAELISRGVLTESGVSSLRKTAAGIVDEAEQSLVRREGKKIWIPAELYPGESDIEYGVKSDGHEFKDVKFSEREDFPSMTTKSYIDVVPEVMGRILDTDPGAMVLGEEVGHMKGGAYLATKGLFLKHRERIIDTPISESGFTGMALGLALLGKHPVVEIMFPDFALVAADQIFNQIGKNRYMYGNQNDIPLVMRTRVSMGTGYGAQHSMDPAALFALYAGWRIVAPSTPFDYIGLFNTAMRSLDPVLVIEHHALYPTKGEVPADRDYYIPFGKARVAREGKHLTLASYSLMTQHALEAAEILAAEGIDVEIVDLRTVDYLSIDYETLGRSIRKTGRLLIAEEGHFVGGVGAQVADEVQRRFFDYLDGEIVRVAGRNIPTPVSKTIEDLSVPHAAEIVKTVRGLSLV